MFVLMRSYINKSHVMSKYHYTLKGICNVSVLSFAVIKYHHQKAYNIDILAIPVVEFQVWRCKIKKITFGCLRMNEL